MTPTTPWGFWSRPSQGAPTSTVIAEGAKHSKNSLASCTEDRSQCEDTSCIKPAIYQESKDGDRGTAQVQAQKIVELRRSYTKVIWHRKAVLTLRTETQMALQESANLRGRARGSQQELMAYIRDKGGGILEEDAHYVDIYNRAQGDSNAVDSEAFKAQLLEARLGSMEHRMKDQELHFQHLWTNLLVDTGLWAEAQLGDPSLLDESKASSEMSQSPKLDPVLATYYHNVGEVGMLNEDIANLDMDYHHDSVQRALEVDQGGAEDQSESQHTVSYKERRADLVEKRSAAIAAAETAKQTYLMSNLANDMSAKALEQLGLNMPLDEMSLPGPLHMPEPIQPTFDRTAEAETGTPPVADLAPSRDEQVLEWAIRIARIDTGQSTAEPSLTKSDVDRMRDFEAELRASTYVAVNRPRRNSMSHIHRKASESVDLLY